MLRFFRYVGLGALIAYFFDPQNGHSRRSLARERIPALLGRSSEHVEKAAKEVTSEAKATKAKATKRRDTDAVRVYPDGRLVYWTMGKAGAG